MKNTKIAKRTLSLLLTVLMVIPMTVSLAIPASAAYGVKYKVEGGYIYFTSTGAITDCDESVTSANIPEVIDGVNITSIGAWAFSGCESLTLINIPDGVTSIGERAFRSCKSLTSITIPEGVTSIGDYAFPGCESLTSINIPDGVTNIGNGAFYGCVSLTSINIPDGVTSIGESAFYGCKSLTSINIPDGVTSIGDYAFAICNALKDVWFNGTKSQAEAISISIHGNDRLMYATWHHKSCESEHEWGEWEIITPISCLNDGEETRTCINCDATETNSLPADEHSFGEWSIDTAPTCVSEGKEIRVCTECYTEESKDIPATGIHSFVEWSMNIAPTCELDGIEFSSCLECGIVENRSVPAIGHSFGEWFVDVEATCVTDGSKIRECSNCYISETKSISAIGEHSFGEWIVTVEPTMFTSGEQTRKCENCNITETEEIEKLETTNPFTDVKEGQWYTEGILWCYHNGYMAGVGKTTFGRKDNVTRAMFVTILAKIDGADTSVYKKMSFSDVPAGQWYSGTIEWAYQNDYAAGLGEGIFGYKQNVSREQIALFFYTYSSKNGIDVTAEADLNGYSDHVRVHSWAYDAVSWAVAKGLISGTSATTLSPRDSATRAEIAVIIKSFVENVIR